MNTKKLFNLFLALALALGTFATLPPAPARAATTHNVTNTNNSGAGSLRQAIVNAVDGDTINLTGISGTITLASELVVNKSVTITGPGANALAVSGNNAVRVFNIASGKTVSISGLTVSNGRVEDNLGAGILNLGNLTLNNVVVTNNTAARNTEGPFVRGGGIYSQLNESSLTITNSTISNNTAAGEGGGIFIHSGELNLQNVTIDNNHVTDSTSVGGGINIGSNVTTSGSFNNLTISNNSSVAAAGGLIAYSSFGIINSVVFNNSVAGGTELNDGRGGGMYLTGSGTTYTLTNVTISGNSASHAISSGVGGGGIFNVQTLNLYNVTITANTSQGAGGGIYGTANMYNTIIAGNTSTSGASEDCAGTFSSSYGYNLIQVTTTCTLTGTTTGNITGQDPLLGPLANNTPAGTGNSLTRTHRLLPGSPAIDAGYSGGECPGTDQRGIPRPQDGNGDGNALCDIGAYEVTPITTFKSAATPDGWILESSETSGAGGTLNKGGKTLLIGDDAQNRQYRAILSFPTASLPDDAIINKVTLKVKRQGITGGGNPITTFGGFMVDIKTGNFNTAGLQLADFSTTGNKTYGAFKPKLVGGWYTINLTTGKNFINKFGNTQIRLRFKTDDNNNFIANFLSLHSGNAASASKPQLIVEFYTQ